MYSRILCRYGSFLIFLALVLLFHGSFTLSLQASDRDWKTKTPDTRTPIKAQEPCDTTLVMLRGGGFAYYYWEQPPLEEFINMRYEIPLSHGGHLEYFEVGFYQTGTSGTPDPDFFVWLSDGMYPLDSNPPSGAVGEFHVDYDSVGFYPEWTSVQAYHLGIEFDPGEMFHIGGTHANDPGDTLAWLCDDGTMELDRLSAWDGNEWISYEPYGFKIVAYICPDSPESTFYMECGPSLRTGSPGETLPDLYWVSIRSILEYDLNVSLSLLSVSPPADIGVTFDPANSPAPFSSDVTVTIGPSVSPGDYTLTFEAVGHDEQSRICDVTLRVQPLYGEALVYFDHGAQRATNFGAVGNSNEGENFVWYGTNYLFDGTFIVSTTDAEHMALDVYNCEQWGWTPTESLDVYYDPEYNANVAYANFFSETIPGEYDSVFFIGIMEECVDFSIKIKIYYNPTQEPIDTLYPSLYEDWDIEEYLSNVGQMDPDHNLMWMFDPMEPMLVFGMIKAPFYDDPMHSMVFIRVNQYVAPNNGFCSDAGGFWGLDSLYHLITTPGYSNNTPEPDDWAMLMTAQPIDLGPGNEHIEIWIDFGRNLNDGLTWSEWWHRVLRYAGFYRGDVNASDGGQQGPPDGGDLVYLINYLFRAGPTPVPYVDQGDVNGDRGVGPGDIVHLIGYLYKDGLAPVDYVRFIPSMWSRPSLFTNPQWR
jgi:hypothetical protein